MIRMKLDKDKIQQAANKLRERLTFDEIRKIPKYCNFKDEEIKKLLENLEFLAIILLESYIFRGRKAS